MKTGVQSGTVMSAGLIQLLPDRPRFSVVLGVSKRVIPETKGAVNSRVNPNILLATLFESAIGLRGYLLGSGSDSCR
jgi:hypothetical protein